jgi:hypothetical protein
MAEPKRPKKLVVGEKVLLDGTVVKVHGDQVAVVLQIDTTLKDLRKFDQSTDYSTERW